MPNQPNPSGPATKSLKDLASSKLHSGNPSMLGDPISLKAESSDSSPPNPTAPASAEGEDAKGEGGKANGEPGNGEQGKGGKGKEEKKSLAQAAKDTNPSMLGDPISLKAETSDGEAGSTNDSERRKGKERKESSTASPKTSKL